MAKIITAKKFDGWLFICPNCNYIYPVPDNHIAFQPDDGDVHFVECEKCKKEFEIHTEGGK